MSISSKFQEKGTQMHLFTASDVLQFALRMEEDGVTFYREAAERAKNFEVKNLFIFLANEEENHKKTFEEFLSKVTLSEPPEDYPGEYLHYLHNYIDDKIFVDLSDKSEKSESSSVAHALEFAIQREMDSVHYYQELKAFVPVEDHPTLDKIIHEERKHFMQLSQVKKDLV
ncbi:MAG: ferritin family protein [Desulfuromonadales bacterium]|nr:ferritin family protein [Desulfuromonadales bacterium]